MGDSQFSSLSFFFFFVRNIKSIFNKNYKEKENERGEEETTRKRWRRKGNYLYKKESVLIVAFHRLE